MAKRAVLYARVSSDEAAEHGYSLTTQIRECQKYADEHGYQVVAEIRDDCSGAIPVAERPGGMQIYELLEQKQVDAVVLYTIDRTTRDERDYPIEYLIFLRDVQDADAELHYVDTGKSEGNIVDLFRAWQAGEERRKIRERTMRGRREKIRQGKFPGNGPRCFGYDIVGQGRDAKLVINEKEAEIVRMIFQMYTEGNEGVLLGVQGIADKLTAMNVLSYGDKVESVGKKRGTGVWTPGQVYPILKRETYIGVWWAYQWKMVKDPLTRRKHRVKRPRNEWVGIPVPAIISEATWKAAQLRLAEGRQMSKRNNSRHQYLMARRMTCAHCGYRIQGRPCWTKGKVYLYYHCNGKCRSITDGKCDLPSYPVEAVDNLIWQWVRDLFQDMEKMDQGLEQIQQNTEGKCKALYARLEAIDKLREDNTRRDDMLLDLYLDKAISKEKLQARREQYEKADAELLAEREDILKQIDHTKLTDQQIRTIKQLAAVIGPGLEKADLDFALRQQFIRELRVTAKLAVEDGERIIYVQCIIPDSETRLSIDSATS